MMSIPISSVLLYVVLPLAAGACAVLLRKHLRALCHGRRGRISDEISEPELRQRLVEVIRGVPRRPPLLSAATSAPISMLVDACLLSGCPSQALREAELEVLANPAESSAFVALAKALLYCHKEEQARAALRFAQRLGADDAEFDYLRARLRPPDRHALILCLRACRKEPAFAEALYLCARLSLRLGFEAEGARLLRRISPLMQISVEHARFRRDLACLDREGSARARRLLWRAGTRAPANTVTALI